MSPADSSYIESLLPFYKQHVEKVILPFWSRALDHQNGGIYTCLDNTGQNLVSRDKFTWSQGRYVWAWSKVAAMTAENRLAFQLYHNVVQRVNTGWDVEFGGVLRFVDSDGGKPKGEMNKSKLEIMIADTWDMKLWWSHSEALYATLLGYWLTGNTHLIDLHHKIKNYAFETFPNSDKDIGEWIQIRDRKGNSIDQVVALPVKDPFHILRSLLLMMDVLETELETVKSKGGYG